MALEADLREIIREATRLAIRDELPAILRAYLDDLAGHERRTPDRGKALSTEQAGEYAGVSPSTIRAWVNAGQLRAQRAGRVLKIRRGDLDAFLARSGPREEGVIDLSERAREILSGKRK